MSDDEYIEVIRSEILGVLERRLRLDPESKDITALIAIIRSGANKSLLAAISTPVLH
jgi:hypothetical protein